METIRLSPDEVWAANHFGMTLQEYARGKHKLQRMAEEHEKWLQTPAGVEYMDKQNRQRQRELLLNRERCRRYRERKRALKAQAKDLKETPCPTT
jgi:hypothetical protein